MVIAIGYVTISDTIVYVDICILKIVSKSVVSVNKDRIATSINLKFYTVTWLRNQNSYNRLNNIARLAS